MRRKVTFPTPSAVTIPLLEKTSARAHTHTQCSVSDWSSCTNLNFKFSELQFLQHMTYKNRKNSYFIEKL